MSPLLPKSGALYLVWKSIVFESFRFIKFSHDCSVSWNAIVGEGREACDKLAPLLPSHLKELQDEIKKYEAQLDDLFALVKGK